MGESRSAHDALGRRQAGRDQHTEATGRHRYDRAGVQTERAGGGMNDQSERTVKALAIGLPIGGLIGVAFVLAFDDPFLGASSALTFGVVIAALIADRWSEE